MKGEFIMKRILCLIVLLVGAEQLSAQHYSAWLRTTLQLPIGGNWSTAAEFQYIRQNDLGTNNPFQKDLMRSYRHWIYYRINDDAQLEVSPFASYASYNLIQLESDRHTAPVKEFRATAAISMQRKIFRQLYLTNRTALEDRIFFRSNDVIRFRQKIGLRYDWERWSVNTYNELLVNTAGVNQDHFFDHNRIGLSVAHSFTRNMKVELSYLYINRMTKDATGTLKENRALLNVSYKLK